MLPVEEKKTFIRFVRIATKTCKWFGAVFYEVSDAEERFSCISSGGKYFFFGSNRIIGFMKTAIIFLIVCLNILSCNQNSIDNGNLSNVEAKYVLPYPVGKAYLCSQGFNSSFSHYGTFKYSVDFDMSIGTLITAARKGRVVYIVENHPDGDLTVGHENVVIVMHEDTTYARYTHLTTNGVLVEVNQLLMPGDTLGLSGNSGHSNHPHLHFDVTGTFTGRSDQTIPFDFKNTISHPVGFEKGVVYEAFPY